MRNKTDIVKLMHVTQYKAGASIILWADHYFIVMTAYHVNACLKVICCTVEKTLAKEKLVRSTTYRIMQS